MTTGEGGMLTTNDEKIAKIADSLRHRGRDLTAGKEIYDSLGSNHHMTEFEAILGLAHLKHLDEFIGYRNQLADIYKERLREMTQRGVIGFQEYPANVRHAYWRFVITLRQSSPSRETIQQKLGALGIPVDWPYDPLLHLQPVFQKLYSTQKGSLPQSEQLAQKHFCVPMHMKLKQEDAEFIAERLFEVLDE
jgi:dTDP-4-amino-4,6-dideoxygalactose transaminase